MERMVNMLGVFLLLLYANGVSPMLLGSNLDAKMMSCNSSITINASHAQEHILIEGSIPVAELIGKPYYCQYELIAPNGYHPVVEVTHLVTGGYFDYANVSSSRKWRCGKKNYMRIWDGFSHQVYKPTELCGFHLKDKILVKRIISGRQVRIEYKTEEFTDKSAYEARVYFVKNDYTVDESHYGGYYDVNGKLDGICNWEIEVNKCIGYCEVVSPGYPGIYPPHLNCSYKLVNRDGDRVELYLDGGTRSDAKFDIKRTEQCEEDRVVVYDGPSNKDPMIGIFCGHNVPEVISSGDSLFMEFTTQAGRPPWTYSGFDARVGHRWPSTFNTGMPITNTKCSWEFTSSMESSGQFNTPDHKIDGDLVCEYRFHGKVGEYVELKIVFHTLKPNREFIYIYDGTNLPERIWSEDDTASRRDVKYFNTTTSSPIIKYELNGGQISNHIPVFMYYEFKSAFKPTTMKPIVVTKQALLSKLGDSNSSHTIFSTMYLLLVSYITVSLL